MASRTITTITDDLDGSEGAETVIFALMGQTYEIDLKKKHIRELMKALDPYMKAARKPSAPRGPQPNAPKGRGPRPLPGSLLRLRLGPGRQEGIAVPERVACRRA